MPGRILMIEDEPDLVLTVGNRLTAEGYQFESAPNGPEGEHKAQKEKYDLILIDVKHPGKHGAPVCKYLRPSGINAPILMITEQNFGEDPGTALKLAAYDSLNKPFEMSDLLLRIKSLIKRSEDHLKIGQTGTNTLSIDLKRGFIVFYDHECALSAQEIKLLDYFCRHENVIISREELLASVWGYDSDITTRTIDVHVARLRQKMGDIHDVPRYIHTVRGIGYKFTPPNA